MDALRILYIEHIIWLRIFRSPLQFATSCCMSLGHPACKKIKIAPSFDLVVRGLDELVGPRAEGCGDSCHRQPASIPFEFGLGHER